MSTSELDPPSLLQKFKEQFRGRIIRPEDAKYDFVRKNIWNLMHDKRPALIVQPTGVRDIIEAVKFARESQMPVSVKGGGHNSSGSCIAEGGLVIDMKKLRGIKVDKENKTVWAQGGCRWRDVDHETQLFNLAVPGGVVSSTGVAGLTLGGGWGYLTKQHGLACDNLLAVELISSNGDYVKASEKENPDLFWAVRGGGGNFGVVYAFEFRAHDVKPIVYGGIMVFEFFKAKEIMKSYNECYKSLPNNAIMFPAIMFHPVNKEDLVLGFVTFYEGSKEEAEKTFDFVLKHGPMANMTSEHPFEVQQQLLDQIQAPTRSYWKAGFIDQVTEDVFDLAAECLRKCPNRDTMIAFENYFNEDWVNIPISKTAFPHRRNHFCMLFACEWKDPALDTSSIEWVRESYKKAENYFHGAYFNFTDAECQELFKGNCSRLLDIKKKYDPDNLFCNNNNNLIRNRERR